MPRFLITGAAGFIGSALVRALLQRGHEVRAFDNLSTGDFANLEEVADRIDFREADLLDSAAVRSACQQVDYIFHEAALASVARSMDDPAASHAANATGTLNLLLAAREAGVKRVVYAGSSSVYGEAAVLPKKEDMPPRPISPYAASKLAGEQYLGVFHRAFGLDGVTLRYFNVFGPRQNAHSQYSAVLAKFIRLMLAGEAPTIYGDGEQSRDFTYIDNVVAANLLACEAPAPQVAGKVFNVATGSRVTLNTTYRLLQPLTGCALQARYAEPRAGDIRDSLADIAQARAAFGYHPAVDFATGLERTVAWYREALAQPKRAVLSRHGAGPS